MIVITRKDAQKCTLNLKKLIGYEIKNLTEHAMKQSAFCKKYRKILGPHATKLLSDIEPLVQQL
jgi:hypothetical protein